MTHKAAVAAYRNAYIAHNVTVRDYERGRVSFSVVQSSAETLRHLRNVATVEKEAAQVRTH